MPLARAALRPVPHGVSGTIHGAPRPSLLPVGGALDGPKVILRGRDRILALQPLLRELAAMTGQAGDAGDLQHFLSGPNELQKQPVLVLSRAASGEPSVRNIKDATLLFEYTLLGKGLRVLSSADTTGRRTVFSAEHERVSTAASAAATLLAQGAHLVHIAYRPGRRLEEGGTDAALTLSRAELPQSTCWALREMEIPLYLPLGPTFDATLARIGQRTRSNLRYYRRRTEREIGCVYVPQVRFTLKEFLDFNRACMFAVPEALATWRFQSLHAVEQPLFAGIHDRDGRWLSLAGGRRRGPEVEIDWQMNRSDLPALSLCTVLRSCLIEEEVHRGSTRLYIEGGTPHPIGRSFTHETVQELTIKRESRYVGLLTRFADRIFPEKNYIGQILTDPELVWHRSNERS